MVAARFYKTRKIKGAQVLGNDPDETWFCVRARNFSKKEHKEFKNRFQSLCDAFLRVDQEEIKQV